MLFNGFDGWFGRETNFATHPAERYSLPRFKEGSALST